MIISSDSVQYGASDILVKNSDGTVQGVGSASSYSFDAGYLEAWGPTGSLSWVRTRVTSSLAVSITIYSTERKQTTS